MKHPKLRCAIRVLLSGILIFTGCIATLYYVSHEASAAGSQITDSYIVERMMYQGLKSCYQDSLVDKITVTASGNSYSSLSVDSIFKQSSPYTYVPNGFASNTKYSCKKENAGLVSSAVPSIMSKLAGSVSLGTATGRDKYFTGMGFVGSNSSGESTASAEKCVQYEYQYGGIEGTAKSNKLCFKANSVGNISEVTDEGGSDSRSGRYQILLVADYKGVSSAGRMVRCESNAICVRAIVVDNGDSYPTDLVSMDLYPQYIDSSSLNDLVAFVDSGASSIADSVQFYAGSSTFTITTKAATKSTGSSSTVANDTYTKTSGTNYTTAVKYLKNYNFSDIFEYADSLAAPLDNTELYYVYMSYLKNIYGAQIAYNFCADSSQGDAYIPVIIQDDSGENKWKYCPIDNLSSVESSSSKVRTGSSMQNEEKGKQVVAYLRAMSPSDLDISRLTASQLDQSTIGSDPSDPGGDPGEDGDAGLVDGCFNNSGVLGWIICPVLRMAGAATTGIYEDIADNYLTIKNRTMTSEALRGVWSKFQGYANILFAILLIIVILSQVTGVGLSNYGIKKVLPRLIITIILVNLSFILCSVAVDLSNILGTSLNDLFMNWNVGGYVAENLNIGTMISNTIESLFSVGAGTAITVVGIKVAIATGAWEGIILSLLLTVLVAFVSIIFFYIILGVRQAAIVILIAVAPVAIVCYALPNTQRVFSRWFKIFSSLLLVFPICGLLMGGSNFASRLLLEVDGDVGFMYFLVAMLLSVIPLFFVPAVLKASMSAMGNLGAKISTMGSRFGNWSSRTVRGTRAFQERQQEAMRNSNMTRNQKIMDKTKLSDAQQTRLAALRAKRASGATLTSSERRELRALGSQQYRYARAASARERGVMEDAMADVATRREMLEHGSARYEKIVAGAMREQRNRDDAGQIALYEDGKVDAFGGGGKVRGDSLDDLAKEHAALLAHVADNPEDEIAASKLRAVQTLLGKMGPNGFDKMEDNFGNLMANHSQFSSTNSKGLGIATSHLSRNFAGQIKANSRTFDKILTDFNSDRFSQQGTFAQQTFTDALGKTQTKYMSSYYGAQGAQSIKAENVNDLGDTYYDNLLRATITGDLQGKDLEQVLNVFNEAEAAAAAGKLTLKGEVRQRIQAIKNAAYASSALNGGVRSEGSRMIGTAGAAGIDGIVRQIESAGDWSTMSTAERKQYSDLVNNITDSLKKDAHTVEDVRQLQQALATARGKNIETAVTGGNLISQVGTADLHSYKIPRGTPQKVAQPHNARRAADGRWYANNGTGRPLTPEETARAEQIEQHNNQIDIENGQV